MILVGNMALRVKELVTKPDNLNFTPRSLVVGGESQSQQVCPQTSLHVHVIARTPPHTK